MPRSSKVESSHRFIWLRGALLALLTLLAVMPGGAIGGEGIWSPAASLATSRYQHTATLLPNGKILVAGGYRSTWPYAVAGAELYDPTSSSWCPAGAMSIERRNHTATLLPNGKVLVVGGNDNTNTHSTAELYDPATNSWSAAASMSSIRQMHTATLLADGKILVVGGHGNGDLSSAEIYDPVTNSWSAAGSLATARRVHTATLLPSGKVLVAGGGNNSTQFYNAELYDPATNSWSSAGSLTTARADHTAMLLPNGKVLVAGGYASLGDQFLNSSEIYDPGTNSWSAGGTLATGRAYHTATLLPNGRLLVTGGHNYTNFHISNAELYDPASNSWSAAGSLVTPRYQHTATLLASGKVITVGGTSTSGEIASAESYDSSVAGWTPANSLATGRLGHSATSMTNGKVLVAGGEQSGSVFATVELYNPGNNSWTAAASMASPRSGHRAILLPNGKVLVVGGRSNPNSGYLSSAELYDPATNSWSGAGSMAVARSLSTVTLLANGKVLVAGGGNDADEPPTAAELYDPATNSWNPAGSLAMGRYNHTATLLPSGKVMIAAGNWEYVPTSEYASLSSVEIYDPVINQWSTAGTLATSRARHSATLLPTGKVLVAGGTHYQGGYFYDQISSELYDPATDTWSAAGSLSVTRIDHTATLLPDGTILAVGGYGSGVGEYLASTESFDPASNSWKAAGPLASGRAGNSATLLPNGSVLITGGVGFVGMGNGVLASAEIFNRGLGFTDSRRPVISGISNNSGNLFLTGTGFRGDSEGSGGSTGSSPSDYPLVQLQRVQEGQQAFVLVDPATNWSATSVAINRGAISHLVNGTYLAIVYVNGVPSVASFLSLSLDPNTSVTPAGVIMGNVYVGETAVNTITLSNTGTRELQIASTVITGADAGMFARGAGGTCGATLAIGASCTMEISFTPTASGSKTAVLGITSNNPTPITVSLTGTGILPQYPLTFSLAGSGSGTVSGTTSTSPPTLYFTTGTSQSMVSGTTVSLNAAPAIGSVFGGWGGDCTGSGACNLTMSEAKSITATFTLDSTPPVTTANPAGGSYSSTQLVALTSNEPATIYYTIDGSEPTTGSTVYSGPITISSSATLKYFAIDGAVNRETTQSQTYQISGQSSGWSVRASLPYGLSRAFSAVADGKIFILGGTPATASIISFDPAANSWSTRPSLTTPVFGGAAVAWGTTIYLMGGLDEQFNYLNSVIAYDTINGTSTPVGSLIYSRARMNAVLFNNKIYVVGGSNAETTIEEYDLAGNSSRVAGTLPEPTLLAGVAAYGDRIIIAGGGTGNTKTWSFDPATGSFTALASLPSTAEARNLIVNNDRLYLVESWGYDNINYIYEYNIGANTWSIATNVPTLRNVPMVEALNGLLYVMGGDDATGSKANEAWTLNSGWTVNSVNPYRSDMIDWPASQYGTVTVGTNIKIGSLYYYVTESDVPSWSGSGHVRAALSDCDQITGLPIGPANMIGSQGRPITYDTNPPSVTATPAGGTYAGPLTVTLTTDKPGTIYYTTDGTEPTSYSPVYSGPLYIAASTTLKFFARDAVNSEPVQTQVYSITVAEQGIINTVAGNGVAGFTGDGGTAVGSSLNYPEDAAVDLDGNIYIADSANNRIRRVDKASGSIATIAGNGLAEFSGDGGPAYMAGLNRPFAVALDTSGNIYISDNQNYRVRKIDMASFIITTVAGNGTSGATGDGGLATAASLGDIRGLAVDAAGSIYIADSGSNGIRKVEKTTGIITTIATGYHPEGVTLDRTGNLYYAETWGHVIVRIDKATSAKSIVAGNGMGGYSGDGGPATQASLYAPHRIVLDGSGNIYISDTFNHRIRKVNSATGLISTLAGTGTAGYSGDGGPATAAMIVNPRGLSIDSNGTIFFADSSSRVRAISGGTSDTNPPDTTATPPGGTYQAPQWVTLSANEPATIYYTVDGTLPTPASAVYGGPIYVGSSMTLQYFARDAAGNQEPVKSEYFTIKQDQYISFPVIDARTYGDAPFTLGATASSGLAISYTSDNLAVATVSGNTITIVGAGTVNITATQWGDYYYNSASPVIQTLTVHKSPATVALGNLSATYDGAAKTVSATTSPSGLSVTFTYNGAGTVPVAAGTYAVVGTISSANYQGSATGTMIIAPAATSISISQSSPNPSTYGQPVTISATVSPVGASGKVRFSNGIGWAEEVNVNPASGSASLSATMMPAGVNTITAQYTGDNNHLQSPVSTGVTQIVNKANQTISFAAIANKIAGGPEFTLNATATSALPVSFISSDPAVAQVSGNTVTIAGPGTVTIIASQWGDSNYNAANAVTQSFTVLPVEQGIKLIDNGIDSFFTTFSAAYNGITSGIGTSIRLPITTLTEILVFDKNHELIILGGYDPIGGTYSGVTTIQGSITIQNGTVIIAEPLSII